MINNRSNFKKASKMIQYDYLHSFWAPCDTHCITLMMGIGKIVEVKNTMKHTNYCLIHPQLQIGACSNATFCEGGILQPNPIRYTIYYYYFKVFTYKEG